MGDDEPKQLHVALFPFMAPGHKIPILHIARLFAARNNVSTTILTTPLNVPTFTGKHGLERVPSIDVEVFNFPSTEAGIPEGCEDVEQALCLGIMDKFLLATEKFQEQLEHYLEKTRPNCLVADMFFSWTTESAAKFNIPVLVFHTTGFFTLCAGEVDRLHQSSSTNNVSTDNEEFVLPSLPHQVKMTKSQFPRDVEEAEYKERLKRVQEHDLKSYGAIVNTFYELEPEYVEFFRNKLERQGWHIGPVCLSNLNVKNDQNGNKIENEVECLKWLNSKKSCSVVFICFGSAMVLRPPQLMEIAMALYVSEQEFIWVMSGDKGCRWLPPPEMERMISEGKGILIQGWAPQVRILEHEAIGAFVTHCGWNSTLEAISAGVPMVTWPLFAEQFFNEKLVTSILNIGVPVGANKYCDRVSNSEEDIIKRDAIMKALEGVMMGNEAQERRKKAKKLKEMAWKAMEEGGSSYNDLTRLIDELRAYQA